MRRRELIHWCVIVTLGAALFFLMRRCGGRDGETETHTVTRIDTLVVRDTIRDTVLVPQTRHIVRIDTVWLRSVDEKSPADSIKVETPIEQKIYQTDDYRAVVEGFRPALVEMEIYRNTLHIDRETHTTTTITPRPKRWGIGIQIGYGYAPTAVATGRNFHPYVGIGAQYNIIMW